MTRADFYLIDKPRFRDDPLLLVCELVRKAFAAEQPTLILARSPEQADALDEKLWEFDDDSFIPHQIAGDADDEITAVVIAPPGVRWRSALRNINESCAMRFFRSCTTKADIRLNASNLRASSNASVICSWAR